LVVWLAGLVPARAGDVLASPVWAEVVRVVDGDTIEVRACISLGQEIFTLVRFADVGSPLSNTVSMPGASWPGWLRPAAKI
jgi:hypothetical protein